MANAPKKFLDANGLTYFASLLNNYPTNSVLQAVINAIDSTKADKSVLATTTNNGLMSKDDKIALNNLNSAAKTELSIGDTNTIIVNDAYDDEVKRLIIDLPPQFGPSIIGKNKFNPNVETLGYYISATGVPTLSAEDAYTEPIPVNAGDTYYIYGFHNNIGKAGKTGNKRAHGYNSNGDWVGQLGVFQITAAMNAAATEPIEFNINFTVPNNVAYIKFSHRQDDTSIMIEKDAKTQWEAYAQIDPILSYNSINVSLSDGDTIQNFPVTFNQPIWVGQVDLLEGTITSTYGEIDTYNGETLPGKWESDRDDYAPNTTPTIGAQVIYELSTPSISTFTPYTINTSLGYNELSVNKGVIQDFVYYSRATTVHYLNIESGSLRLGNTTLTEQQLNQLLQLI